MKTQSILILCLIKLLYPFQTQATQPTPPPPLPVYSLFAPKAGETIPSTLTTPLPEPILSKSPKSNIPLVDKVDSVENGLILAEKHIKKAIELKENYKIPFFNQPNLRLANDYCAQALELSKAQMVDTLLFLGWLKYKVRDSKTNADGEKLIGEGLSLSPGNPMALYMLARINIDKYWDKYLEPKMENMQEIKIDKNNLLMWPPRKIHYDPNRDNSLLEQGQIYLEKAIAFKPDFAEAYLSLAGIFRLKKQMQKCHEYELLFIKHQDKIDPGLWLHDKSAIKRKIEMTLYSLKRACPEKLEELLKSK